MVRENAHASESWLKVTFSGDVKGNPYSLTVFYGAPTQKIAKARFQGRDM